MEGVESMVQKSYVVAPNVYCSERSAIIRASKTRRIESSEGEDIVVSNELLSVSFDR